MACAAAERVEIRVLDALKDVGMLTALGEIMDSGTRLSGPSEGVVYPLSVSLPSTVPEICGGVLTLQGVPRQLGVVPNPSL